MTDRQTDDRQTSCHGIVRAMHTRRAVKIIEIGLFLTELFQNNKKFDFFFFKITKHGVCSYDETPIGTRMQSIE